MNDAQLQKRKIETLISYLTTENKCGMTRADAKEIINDYYNKPSMIYKDNEQDYQGSIAKSNSELLIRGLFGAYEMLRNKYEEERLDAKEKYYNLHNKYEKAQSQLMSDKFCANTFREQIDKAKDSIYYLKVAKKEKDKEFRNAKKAMMYMALELKSLNVGYKGKTCKELMEHYLKEAREYYGERESQSVQE